MGAVVTTDAARSRYLAISLHDVAPQTWHACTQLLRLVDELTDAPVTLLVVPDYHRKGLVGFAPSYRAALERRLQRGDELALHGWNHLDEMPMDRGFIDRLRRTRLTDREGEFSALPFEECRKRLEAGRDWFEAWGWPLYGFIAPAWMLGEAAWDALAQSGFRYTATRSALHLLAQGRAHRTRTLVYSTRSPLRARSSLWWNGWQSLPVHRDAIVRIALHPADAARPDVMRHIAVVLCALHDRREALTKASLCERLSMTATQASA